MAFRVRFARRGARDLDQLYESINAPNSPAAVRWFQRLVGTIELLSANPRMGAPTHEDSSRRQLVYGNKPHLYRVIYKVDDDTSTVTVLQIRHGKRPPFRADEL